MIKPTALALSLLASVLLAASVDAGPVPASFVSTGEDRQAIDRLLNEYATAVSTRDQSRFEELLLNKSIPFSGIPLASREGVLPNTQDYERFRKGVFEGPAFNQRFQDVEIRQDGLLASVSLVFVNSSAMGSSWGWKTRQLLKIDGRWKIASEFYTGH